MNIDRDFDKVSGAAEVELDRINAFVTRVSSKLPDMPTPEGVYDKVQMLVVTLASVCRMRDEEIVVLQQRVAELDEGLKAVSMALAKEERALKDRG